MYVFDATPLIYLATANRLALLEALEASCVVPDPVHVEVVTVGIEEGHADARRVERAIENGLLEVITVEETERFARLRENDRLSEADVAVLSVANANDGTAVMDETYGRDVADAEGIDTRGTAYLVVRLVDDGMIGPETARSIVDDMLEAGWYCAPDLYAKILQRIDERS